jgi:hypothetical protein
LRRSREEGTERAGAGEGGNQINNKLFQIFFHFFTSLEYFTTFLGYLWRLRRVPSGPMEGLSQHISNTLATHWQQIINTLLPDRWKAPSGLMVCLRGARIPACTAQCNCTVSLRPSFPHSRSTGHRPLCAHVVKQLLWSGTHNMDVPHGSTVPLRWSVSSGLMYV